MYNLGIDVGSTTVKLALTDENNHVLYKSYQRHRSKIKEVLVEQLDKIGELTGADAMHVAITGSAGMGIAQDGELPFVQEVFATTSLVCAFYPAVNVVIELGGEDAKIIFLGEQVEEKMNSTCAGGTGAFIDQMAALLQLSLEELDSLSLKAEATYPIASRCGVFAKTDIQPLLNQGASKENIAASVYSSVADQTIGGLAGGRPIEGTVLFLGGPLSFCQGLRQAFVKVLPEVQPLFIDDSEYFVAFGAAYHAFCTVQPPFTASEILDKMQKAKGKAEESLFVGQPLFCDMQEYTAFSNRHQQAAVKRAAHPQTEELLFVGIDAGSTTTKIVAINAEDELVFEAYESNGGSPLQTVCRQLTALYEYCPHAVIGRSVVTGYGGDLIQSAFCADEGIVETIAHYTAASYFAPDVDFIIDIGGQDMKCFGIKNSTVDSIVLNEACSSGCGSFLQTFAEALGYTSAEFAKIALFAKEPVDLGSRCTVFMNSSVKQAQKNGAAVEDIAAGLALSIVKNALYKVLRVNNAKSLGNRIVVQGGTFLNDAVLRAFEQHLGGEVVRPNIAGLMGAFGAALLAKRQKSAKSTLLSPTQIKEFSHTSNFTRCGLCQNHCSLTVIRFSDGRKLISGNRCERPYGITQAQSLPNLYTFKQDYLARFTEHKATGKTIGIPLVLNFYDTLPFWFTVFQELGFGVCVSARSSRELYRKGQHTIPSDTVCYGAKLVHGHVIGLMEQGVDAIFYPQMSYNYNEGDSDNHYHCPIVAYYPQLIHNNVLALKDTPLLNGFLDLNSTKFLAKQLLAMLVPLAPHLKRADIEAACQKGTLAQQAYRSAVQAAGAQALRFAKENHQKTIVLAGRPYHIDSEINHGIDKLISSLGFVVLSEDAMPPTPQNSKERTVLNQWSYHARMYRAAEQVCTMPNTELVQMVSFGCGLDAVTTDEIREILLGAGKLYTSLKIDEISNLGAVKIRMRSLLAAMQEREGEAFETATK